MSDMTRKEITTLMEIFEGKMQSAKKEDAVLCQFCIDILKLLFKDPQMELDDFDFWDTNPVRWFKGKYGYSELKKMKVFNHIYSYYGEAKLGYACRKAWELIQIESYILNTKESFEKSYDISDISGYEYESLCAIYLKNNGYDSVITTPKSGDQGIDITAEKNGIKYGIQCKYYSNSVPNKAVQEAYSGAKFYGCDKSMVITNSKFSKSAQELAQSLNTILVDGLSAELIMNDSSFHMTDEVKEGYIDILDADNYDSLLGKAISIILDFGKASIELIRRTLNVTISRAEMIIFQLSELQLIKKNPLNDFYNLTVGDIAINDNNIYIYRMEPSGYELREIGFLEGYTNTSVKKVICEMKYDRRLYTEEFDNNYESIFIYQDIIYIIPTRPFLNQNKRNKYNIVAIPIVGITEIDYSSDKLFFKYDKTKWNGLFTKNQVRLPYSSNEVLYENYIPDGDEGIREVLREINKNEFDENNEDYNGRYSNRTYYLGEIISSSLGLINNAKRFDDDNEKLILSEQRTHIDGNINSSEYPDKGNTTPKGKWVKGKWVPCDQPLYTQPINDIKFETHKNSRLSIVALVLSILGCTSFIGLILAIMDLLTKDGKKKTLSVVAICISGVWFLLLDYFVSIRQ